MAVDDVFKGVTQATMSEQIIQELQDICRGMLADRWWLVPATCELWTGYKMRAAEHLFEMGATNHRMEQWMLRNVQILGAQHQQNMQDRAQSERDRAEKGGNSQTRETLDDRIAEDDLRDAGRKSAKTSPTERLKKNAPKLRKRLGAIESAQNI